ncbi:2705_t:CDS:2, partial [Cetraspora pellucida]
RYVGSKKPYYFTPYLIIGDYTNKKKVNKWATCKACYNILREEAKLKSIALIKFKDSNLELPSWHALDERILKVEIQQLNSIQKEKVIKDIVGVTVAFDDWKNINKESIFGKILITSNENGELSLLEVVCKPVGNPDFWLTIVELQLLLAPICNCLNQLQKDTSRLYDVLYTFGYFYEIMNKYSDYEFAELQEYHEEKIKPELGSVALRIHSILVNSASVECLFSSMSFFHTKLRNRLGEAEKSFHFAPLIYYSFEDNFNDNESTYKHDFDKNNNIIETSVKWNKILNSWFSLVNNKELAYDEFNEFECNVTFDEENINAEFIVCETQHLADNCNAKWLLENLFINNLSELSYVLATKKCEEEKKKKETEYLHQIAEKIIKIL